MTNDRGFKASFPTICTLLALILLMAGTGIAQQPTPLTLSSTDSLIKDIYDIPLVRTCAARGWPSTSICEGSALAVAREVGVWETKFSEDVETAKKLSNDEAAESLNIVSVQGIVDPVQNAENGNTAKPCGPENHDDWCVDPAKRHVVNRLYGVSKDNCEKNEGVPCEELQPCVAGKFEGYESCRRWVPIGKPVFVDETPAPKQEKPPAVNPIDSITGCAGAGCLTTFSLPYEEPRHEMLDIREGYATASIGMDKPVEKDGRKVYTITALTAWTCLPTTATGNTVTIVCLKSEPSANEHKGGTK